MTEQERREHFAFLNGVAADMKESRKELIEVLEGIKAEIKELIDWHDCPMELDNGNDAWYCEACNMAISIIDKHIKEYKE